MIICLILIGMIIMGYEYREWMLCRREMERLQNQLDSYKRTVYVAAEELSRGEIITKDNVRKEVRYADMSAELFMQEDAFGKASSADIPEGGCILNGMTQNVMESVREVFLSEIELTDHLEQGDRVDIRIRYPNAEDYIVLSDKVLVTCETGAGMVLRLTEEEILLLSSAVFDSATYDNTNLYAVRYPEQEQMEPGRINYVPNKEILVMLDKEKAEGEFRTALEQRLEQTKK